MNDLQPVIIMIQQTCQRFISHTKSCDLDTEQFEVDNNHMVLKKSGFVIVSLERLFFFDSLSLREVWQVVSRSHSLADTPRQGFTSGSTTSLSLEIASLLL